MTAIRGYKLNCVSKVNILFYSLLTQFNLHPRFVCYNRVRIIIGTVVKRIKLYNELIANVI